MMSDILDMEALQMNERMRSKRQELKFSQAQLAERIGVSRQTINMIESGEYNPTLALCTRICRELGCTLDELFWDDSSAGKE